MEEQIFYRVSNIDTNQGLWYDQSGMFTGLIHNKMNFCTNNELQMPFDDEFIGYLSATKTLDELYAWFSKDDIRQLQEYDYTIVEYISDDYKFLNGHWLINQSSAILKGRVLLSAELSDVPILA